MNQKNFPCKKNKGKRRGIKLETIGDLTSKHLSICWSRINRDETRRNKTRSNHVDPRASALIFPMVLCTIQLRWHLHSHGPKDKMTNLSRREGRKFATKGHVQLRREIWAYRIYLEEAHPIDNPSIENCLHKCIDRFHTALWQCNYRSLKAWLGYIISCMQATNSVLTQNSASVNKFIISFLEFQ